VKLSKGWTTETAAIINAIKSNEGHSAEEKKWLSAMDIKYAKLNLSWLCPPLQQKICHILNV